MPPRNKYIIKIKSAAKFLSVTHLHHFPILSNYLVIDILILFFKPQAHLKKFPSEFKHSLDARFDRFTAHWRHINVHVIGIVYVFERFWIVVACKELRVRKLKIICGEWWGRQLWWNFGFCRFQKLEILTYFLKVTSNVFVYLKNCISLSSFCPPALSLKTSFLNCPHLN